MSLKVEVKRNVEAKSRDFAFTLTDDQFGRLKQALTVRYLAGQTMGLIESFAARVVESAEEG